MQEEPNVNIQIDTDVLKERSYANVAWADQYQIEILTESSRETHQLIESMKNQQRIQLKNEIIFNEWIEEPDIAMQIQNRMYEMPLFTSKADYYSLNIKEEQKEYSPVFLLGFFLILGLAGYLLARFKAVKKEGAKHVHNDNYKD